MDPAAHQHSVAGYFEATSEYWHDVYGGVDVASVVLQERNTTVESWASELERPAGSAALDVGCGAGHMTVALACDGLNVHAVDLVDRMLELTEQAARDAEVEERVEVRIGDVHSLPFARGSFSLAVAVGVMPWAHSPAHALAELARVVGPGGRLIVTWDNRARLNAMLDPSLTPLLRSPRRVLHTLFDPLLGRAQRTIVAQRMYGTDELHELLAPHGLEVVRERAVGYGPFTLMKREVVPTRLAVKLNRNLQRLADRGVRPVRATAAHVIVLARKPALRGSPRVNDELPG